MYPEIHLILGGEACLPAGGATMPVINPATEEVLARVASAGSEDAERAAQVSAAGFLEWSGMSPFERSKVLRRAAERMRASGDEAALALTLEQGKPLAQAKAEWLSAADLFDWFAEEGRRSYGRIVPSRSHASTLHVLKQPIGPVALLCPWNFPAWTAVQKIAPALAAGCSIVVKASEEAPATVWHIARALLEAGLPPAAISVLWGDAADIGSALIAAPEIRKISLTGSTRVGRIVAAAAGERLKPVTLELGGHAPVIVAGDVDPERLAALSVQWKFRNAGQVCTSPTRFLVAEGIYERFVAAFGTLAARLKVGPGLDAGTEVGPLTTDRQIAHIEHLVADARQHGATIASGGERVGNKGYFFAPTVVSDASPDLAGMNEEPFGPLAFVMKVRDHREALKEANRLPVGLASYAFTNDRSVAEEISREMQAGMLGLNNFALTSPEAPFGGLLDSGYGSEGGSEGMDAFLTTRLVSAMDRI